MSESNKDKTNKDEKLKYNPNVTKHDKEILGEREENIRGDNGDDSILYDRKKPVDFAAEDLDIPGRDLPNKHNSSKLKSEENQHYSLGSAHNDNLEDSEDGVD
ncbi:hypothetical protein SAMN03097699_0889 [Flavobacteriaceae bacterium MAR_2010_188]|nr:hypothetical protein SAMN03097699_0889 [Flavobacteriaceae bacterium MAR_2010_188]